MLKLPNLKIPFVLCKLPRDGGRMCGGRDKLEMLERHRLLARGEWMYSNFIHQKNKYQYYVTMFPQLKKKNKMQLIFKYIKLSLLKKLTNVIIL